MCPQRHWDSSVTALPWNWWNRHIAKEQNKAWLQIDVEMLGVQRQNTSEIKITQSECFFLLHIAWIKLVAALCGPFTGANCLGQSSWRSTQQFLFRHWMFTPHHPAPALTTTLDTWGLSLTNACKERKQASPLSITWQACRELRK